MATDMSTRRLQKELRALHKSPLTNPKIVAQPLESNILEWHYLLDGAEKTPYEGGKYWGKLIFPKEYPLKPPSVMMMTPSGRFKPNRRLCLSMSDFHPESWNPLWSVSTILTGLNSFMVETAPTLGSVETTTAQKRKLAKQTMDFNVKDATFCKVFPDIAEEHKKIMAERRLHQPVGAAASTGGGKGQQVTAMLGVDGEPGMIQALYAAGAGIVAVLSILLAMRFL